MDGPDPPGGHRPDSLGAHGFRDLNKVHNSEVPRTLPAVPPQTAIAACYLSPFRARVLWQRPAVADSKGRVLSHLSFDDSGPVVGTTP